MVKSLHSLMVVALLVTACGAGVVATGQPLPSQATPLKVTPTEAVVSDEACPLTIPSQPGMIPPEPYPAEATRPLPGGLVRNLRAMDHARS